jgi:16S rRNA C967 or C1407 C5-methylase (RsmB/RsmF family)
MPAALNLKSISRIIRPILRTEAEQAEFIQALQQPRDYAPALLWMRQDRDQSSPPVAMVPDADRPRWLPEFVDWAQPGQRPGQHARHEAGEYYCLDISSVFGGCVFGELPEAPGIITDLCAAPGGKSLLAWRFWHPDLLIANETIRKRTGALISNLQRCQARPAVVTSMDAAIMAQIAPEQADLVIVDAPCSGQSLLAKGHDNPGCFHESTINLNANRQRRILACAAQCVAPGGHLAYITCTYAAKENEDTVQWLLKRFPDLTPQPVSRLSGHLSQAADFPCYRLWPQQGVGAGAFGCLLKKSGQRPNSLTPPSLETLRAAMVLR